MKFNKVNSPYLRLLIFLIIGVIIGYLYVPNPRLFALLKLVLGVLTVLVSLLFIWKWTVRVFKSKLSNLTWASESYFDEWVTVCVYPILWLIGLLSVWETHPLILEQHFSRHTSDYLIAYIAEPPKESERSYRLFLEVIGGVVVDQDSGFSNLPLSGKLQLTVRKDTSSSTDPSNRFPYSYGLGLLIPSSFVKVAGPRNPGEFDYAAYLERNQCWHQLYTHMDSVCVIGDGYGNPIVYKALAWRDRFVDKFTRFIPNEESQAIASTLILGHRADLDQEVMGIYTDTGTVHVLSVSGMHVVIVFWMLTLFVFWLPRNLASAFSKALFLLVSVWAYALLTGFSPSVLRASAMISVVIVGAALRRSPSILNSISASAFFLIIVDPYILFNIGFQLSYLAVLGIVIWNPLFATFWMPKHQLLQAIVSYSYMSISAQLATFPLATLYFGQFPIYFLLANLLIVIPATLIMYVGFALLLIPEFHYFEAVLKVLGLALSKLILLMNGMLREIQFWPYALWTGIDFGPAIAIALYVAFLMGSLALFLRNAKFLILLGCLVLCIWLSSMYDQNIELKTAELVIHHVRSSPMLSVRLGNRQYVYADSIAYGNPDFAYAVLPYLQRVGSREKVKNLHVGSPYLDDYVQYRLGFLQIGRKIMHIYNPAVYDYKVSQERHPFKIDLLYIPRSRDLSNLRDLQALNTFFEYEALVLESYEESPALDSALRTFTDNGGTLYMLKDNFAYVWVWDR